MIRFIHTADLHLGTENYGKIDSKTGMHTRLLDFAQALNFCITTAIEQQVDFFLFCGDAYKTASPSQTQQKILLKAFLRLYKTGIPVVIVLGNHDNPMSFGKTHSLDIFKELPLDGFYVFAQPETIVLPTTSGPIQIVGIPWPTRNSLAISNKYHFHSAQQITDYITRAISTIIDKTAQQLDITIPAILAAHIAVSTGTFSGSEKHAIYSNDLTFLPSQLAHSQFDYVALGHLHRHQNLNKQKQPPIVYPGSIERIDFGERNDVKGFCLVTIYDKEHTEYEFIKSPMRPFIQIEVQLTEETDQTEQLLTQIKQHQLDNAIVKIFYYLPLGSKDTVNMRSIQYACSRAHHIVGIIPIRQPFSREQRMSLKVEMDLATLLSNYFDTKPAWKGKKNRLIEQALMLYDASKQTEER